MSLDRYRRPRMIVLPPRASAHEAARAMEVHHIAALLIGEGREIIGILTTRDLCLAVVAGDLDPMTTTLRALMNGPVITLDVSAAPAEAARLMREHGVRRIPITEDGVPVGLVTLDDLLHDGEITLTECRRVLIAQYDSDPPDEGARPPSDEAVARAQQRHRARAERTFQRLVRAVERNTGIVDHARSERALGIVLGAVCRRLTPKDAKHFVAQLPSKLQPLLAPCLEGPDKRISTQTIAADLGLELGLAEDSSAELLFALCEVVADSISTGEIGALRSQLPAAMKELFPLIPYRRTG